MRRFIVHGHEAPTDAEISLDDLASGAGRLDLLARSLLSALLTSHDIRTDVKCILVLADELRLTFDGGTLRSLHPDERSAAALVRAALREADTVVGRQPVEPAPGITLRRAGFADTVRELADDCDLVPLLPDGRPAASTDTPNDPVFVLSDHRPFSQEERVLLDKLGTPPISLGPRALHTDQAITVAHNWLDTDGWTWSRPD